MARKEINVFSVSFLDLLSGALAAVIILYIIVPKMSQEQQEAVEQLEELQQQLQQMDSLMAVWKIRCLRNYMSKSRPGSMRCRIRLIS